jgi:hypothetical protein
MRFIAVAILVFLSATSFATTWAKSKVNDPILKGKKCSVNEPMSSGSYIYQWPSKYDQVFWPLTDSNGIWFCEKSGYVSFMADFEELTDKEKSDISKYLKGKKTASLTLNEILIRLEEIYALRDLKPETKNLYLRVFAQWYQNSDNLVKANEYRKIAFDNIESQLKTDLPEDTKLEYLYLAANYARLFGNPEKSQSYLSLLSSAIENLKDKNFSGFAEYLKELSKETPNISPGGKIDPKASEQEKNT